MSRRAIFLDRDGVINVNHGFVSRWEDFHFQPGIFDVVRLARRLGLLPVIVTNQSGIGRGYFDDDAFIRLTEWMTARFADENAPIAAVYYCPHHPEAAEEQLRAEHDWRKPMPGMLQAARDDFGLDLSESIIIGDNLTDIRAGISAGLKATLLLGNAPATNGLEARPTVQVNDLHQAAEWLLQHQTPAGPALSAEAQGVIVRRA